MNGRTKASIGVALGLLVALAVLALAVPGIPTWLPIVWALGVFLAGVALLAGLDRGPARGTALALGLGASFHAVVIAALPALVSLDAFVYFWDESPFERTRGTVPHYPPLYTFVLKLLGSRPSAPLGLATIVGAQHALVLGVALGARHALRSAGVRDAIATLAALAIALDGYLAIYAQSILSDPLMIGLVTASFVLLVEAAARDSRALGIAAGLSSGVAATARLAAAGWFSVGALWIVASGSFPARRRSLALFLAAALFPIVSVLLANRVIYGRAALSAGTGRNLIYRAVTDMPPLTDPDAPASDPMERARRIAWEERASCWVGPYERIKRELGWADPQIDAAFTRWYFEQARRHPARWAAVTLDYAWTLLRAREPCESIVGCHDPRRSPPRWQVQPAGDPPRLLVALESVALPTRVVVLALAALAPLLAAGRARRLALFAVTAIVYFVAITALFELPVPRYRLPVVPFVLVAAALSLDGIAARIVARSGSAATSTSQV
jgi:hypothetical protein